MHSALWTTGNDCNDGFCGSYSERLLVVVALVGVMILCGDGVHGGILKGFPR